MNTYHSENCALVKSLGVGECDCGLQENLDRMDESCPPPPTDQVPPTSEYEDRL